MADPGPGLDIYPFEGAEGASEVELRLAQACWLARREGLQYPIGQRVPLIGPLWARFLKFLHQEIRLYGDALAGRQGAFNTALCQAVQSLFKAHQAQAEADRQALEELRARIAALEERIFGPETPSAEKTSLSASSLTSQNGK